METIPDNTKHSHQITRKEGKRRRKEQNKSAKTERQN